MITLVTGTPGHGKTQRALWMLLNDPRFKGRVVLYANVRGLKVDDPRIANWIPLTDVTQWDTAPQGAVIFIDECHQAGFFPVRGIGKPPKHIEDLATHRHLGLDFLLVTQNGKNMDVFVRRMVELHVHCKRPAQLPYTNIYEFQGFTDCDDRVPTDNALRHERWRLDKDIWTLYESTVENTTKPKLPRIVWAIPVLVALGLGAGYFMYSSFKSYGNKAADLAKSATPATPEKSAPKSSTSSSSSTANEPEFSLSRMSPQQRVEHTMHATRDFGYERVPLNPDYPESAPLYDEVRIVRTFPRVSGCTASKSDCRCVDQQGTPARVTISACFDFVINGRFDPYRDEPVNRQPERSLLASNQQSALATKSDGCYPYLVYGIDGQSWTETRCNGSQGVPAISTTPTLIAQLPSPTAPPATPTQGTPGYVPVDFDRGGYKK